MCIPFSSIISEKEKLEFDLIADVSTEERLTDSKSLDWKRPYAVNKVFYTVRSTAETLAIDIVLRSKDAFLLLLFFSKTVS